MFLGDTGICECKAYRNTSVVVISYTKLHCLVIGHIACHKASAVPHSAGENAVNRRNLYAVTEIFRVTFNCLV